MEVIIIGWWYRKGQSRFFCHFDSVYSSKAYYLQSWIFWVWEMRVLRIYMPRFGKFNSVWNLLPVLYCTTVGLHYLTLQHQYRIVSCAALLKYCQLNGKAILVLVIFSDFFSNKRDIVKYIQNVLSKNWFSPEL